tara:strand:+ start:2319 stop:2654 length:336 start_codon:yes stop_codon:yes gene_type:complete
MAFQQQLKTYIDRNNLNYKYEEKQIEEQQFKARVIIYNNDGNNDTTYEWTDSQISKKIAKNKAAKIVLIKLEIIENEIENENDNNENIKDILIDIRNLLKIMVDRSPPLVG